MAPNPEMRASDVDRDRTAEALREHCAAGRISTDELQERIEAVFESRTLGDLQRITADLPEEDLYELPVPAWQKTGASTPAVPPRRETDTWRGGRAAQWSAWAAVSGINFTIWLILALTGTMVYPWWLWVAGPWAIALAINQVRGPKNNC